MLMSGGQGLRGAASEDGQMFIIMVLVMTAFFLVGAIAIDLGMVLAERRGIQRAADFASLAGSIELPADPATARNRALEWAAKNGYEDGVDGVEIEIRMLCSNGLSDPPPGICDNATPNQPSACVPEVGCDSMRVIINKTGTFPFSSFFGVFPVLVGSGAAASLSFDVIPMDTVILLDDTGSMDAGCNSSQSNSGCPIRESKIAALSFVDVLLGNSGGSSQVGYAPYRGCYNPPRSHSDCARASSIIDLTQNVSRLGAGINSANAAGGSGTNVCLPFLQALAMFNGPNAQGDEGTVRSVVILTDGDNTYSNVSFGQGQPPTACRPTTSPQNSDSNTGSDCSSAQTRERQLDTRTRDVANVLKGAPYNADVYVVGFGVCGSNNANQFPTTSYCNGIGNTNNDNTADRRLLKCIASSTPGTNDHYFEVPNATQLPAVLQVVAWKIAERSLSE